MPHFEHCRVARLQEFSDPQRPLCELILTFNPLQVYFIQLLWLKINPNMIIQERHDIWQKEYFVATLEKN